MKLTTISERPLRGGMVLNAPGQELLPGQFTQLENVLAMEFGLYRPPDYTAFALGQEFSGEPVGLVTVWNTSGTQVTYLITNDQVQTVGEISGIGETPWKYDTGTVAASGSTITGSGTAWETNGIVASDWFVLEARKERQRITIPADSGGNLHGEYFVISTPTTAYGVVFKVTSTSPTLTAGLTALTVAVATNGTAASNAALVGSACAATGVPFTQVALTSAVVTIEANTGGAPTQAWDGMSVATMTQTYAGFDASNRIAITAVDSTELSLAADVTTTPAGADYTIYRRTYYEKPDLVDWAVFDNDLIVATRQRELAVVSDGTTTMAPLITTTTLLPSTGRFKAGCVAVFNDRVFVGDVTDDTDGRVRQRIRWSSVTDKRDFSESTAYYDWPYTASNLKRLVPLGPVLIAYFGDQILLGQATEDSRLPVVFQQIDTQSIGLVGQRAVARGPGGHYFVGQDNVYFLDTNGIRAIGDAIAQQSIQNCTEKWRIQVAVDPKLNRVVFGVPGTSGESFTYLWSYDYRLQVWSYELLATGAYMVANPALNNTVTWAELTASWAELGNLMWGDFRLDDAERSIIVDSGSTLKRQARRLAGLATGYTSTITTRDMDFNTPDTLKTFVRLGLKCVWQTAPTTDVSFTVEGSSNKGISWKSLGTLVVKEGRDEGKVNFALIGSTVRFRITTSAAEEPYYITELTVEVRESGKEAALGTQDV